MRSWSPEGTKIIQSELFWQNKLCHVTMTWYGHKRLLSKLEGKSQARSYSGQTPHGVYIVILPVPCGVPVVLGVVEPAVVEVAAEVVGACSVAVVGAAFAVGVDGVVLNEQQTQMLDKKILNCLPKIKKINSQKILPTGVTVFEPAALSGGGIW